MDVSGSCLIAERQPGGAFTLTPAAADKNAVALLSGKEVRAWFYQLLKLVLACVFSVEPCVIQNPTLLNPSKSHRTPSFLSEMSGKPNYPLHKSNKNHLILLTLFALHFMA